MALIDRAIKGCVAGYIDGKSPVDQSTISSTTISMDPIVSGTSASTYLSQGGGHSLSVAIPALNTMSEVTISTYLFFSATAASTISQLGGSNFIQYDPSGYLTFTLPYSSPLVVRVDFLPSESVHIAIRMNLKSWSISANGQEIANGSTEKTGFGSATTISFSSQAAAEIVVGGIFIYDYIVDETDLLSWTMEAFMTNPDAVLYYNGKSQVVADQLQAFVGYENVPSLTNWGSLLSNGVVPKDGKAQLEIAYPEKFDSSTLSYYVPSISDLISKTSGMIKCRIPSYATGGVRGLLYLKSNLPGQDEFAVELNGSNVMQAYRKAFSVDVSGNENSTWATFGTASGTITAGSNVWFGFGWTSTTFFFNNNSVNSGTLSDYSFNPSSYSIYLGVDRNLANPYYASQAAWTMEVRALDYVETTTATTSYGPHTFFSGSVLTSDVPVRAEGYVKSVIVIDGKTRVPYYYIDGSPSSTSEALL